LFFCSLALLCSCFLVLLCLTKPNPKLTKSNQT
jgi:hypothetical protein